MFSGTVLDVGDTMVGIDRGLPVWGYGGGGPPRQEYSSVRTERRGPEEKIS